MKRQLLFLSVIEGAAVMIAELCGARLLAPVFGSSLYVWASVMGITLAALSAGYFFGGIESDNHSEVAKKLSRYLQLSSFALLVMPIVAQWLLPIISLLPFMPGVVISTVVLLAPAVFLLGSSSPLFIAMQTTSTATSARVSGTVYAVSTVGGIFATFLCGFYLLPVAGIQFTLLGIGLLLFLVSVIVLKIYSKWNLLVLAVLMALHLKLVQKKPTTILRQDGILGQIEVIDVKNDSSVKRQLLINKIIQTEIDLKNKKSESGYLKLLDSLIPVANLRQQALLLGLGGGQLANMLVAKGFRCRAVEFDERIAEAAKNYFFLTDSVQVEIEDARRFVNKNSFRFQLIIADVFKAEEQPAHLFTLESFLEIKKSLDTSGALLINWHGYVNGEIGKGTRILLSTLRAAGFETKLHSNSTDEKSRNLLIEAVPSRFYLASGHYEKKSPVISNDEINTDDNLCIEAANSKANKAWRAQYLNYYQNTGAVN